VTDSPRTRSRLAALIAALTFAVALGVLATSGTAAAAEESCAKQVIADWYDNGRVDRIYELQCYRDAVKALPVDVRDYSSAKDDIMRALLHAQQGETDPGDQSGGGGSGTAGGGGSTGGSTGGSGSGGNSSGGGGKSGAAPRVDTAGPSSVPVPLRVLAGLATLLLALGAAGYLTRRRSGPSGDEPSAPA
jgi:uncharacterized membrane protein YgcG